MAVYNYYCTYGSIPTTPISVYVLDGTGTKQTVAGVTGVKITVYSMATPGVNPIISGAAGSSTVDSAGKTLLQYQPTASDCLNGPGLYVFKFEVDSTGGKKDVWPDDSTYGTWYIAAP